jgi:hypothetical protein
MPERAGAKNSIRRASSIFACVIPRRSAFKFGLEQYQVLNFGIGDKTDPRPERGGDIGLKKPD